jgi:hypothetical protein
MLEDHALPDRARPRALMLKWIAVLLAFTRMSDSGEVTFALEEARGPEEHGKWLK